MDAESSPKIVFLPGLAADEKLFTLQRLDFPNLVALPWQIPKRKEPFDDYLDRWSEKISAMNPVLIGGASFGGIVAQILARKIGVKDCVIFGSAKSPQEVPLRMKIWRPLERLSHRRIVQFWQANTRLLVKTGGRFLTGYVKMLLMHFVRSDPHLVHWSLQNFFSAVMHDGFGVRGDNENSELRLTQIHGTRDPVFPARRIKRALNNATFQLEMISGAGHLPTITHHRRVNRLLKDILEKIARSKNSTHK